MDDLVETHFCVSIREGKLLLEFDDEAYLQRLPMDQAIALRDWLNKAIPTAPQRSGVEK